MIALVPDFEEFRVKLIITDNYAKYLAAIPIQEFQNGEVETDNEYVYYFSFQFGK